MEAPGGDLVARGPVLSRVEDARGLDADLALVAVKTTSLAEVAPGVGDALAAGGFAVPLQNGLDSEDELASAIGRERVIGGVARISAGLTGPGSLYLDGGGSLVLAPLDPEQMPAVERLAEHFESAHVGCEAKPHLGKVLWGKLLWNGPFNAICALTRNTPGPLLEIPEVESLIRSAMHEIVAVARADGAELPETLVDSMIDISRSVFAATKPSMLQDLLAGRETEVEALQGAVVARGQRHGIPTPIHAMLATLLRGTGSKVSG